MPRTCLACSSSVREAIDKALVNGDVTKHIETCFDFPGRASTPQKPRSGTIAKVQERREEKLGDSIYAEMRRVLAKAWELLAKTEPEGDHGGAIVALREVRECLETLNALVEKAEGGSGVGESKQTTVVQIVTNVQLGPP